MKTHNLLHRIGALGLLVTLTVGCGQNVPLAPDTATAPEGILGVKNKAFYSTFNAESTTNSGTSYSYYAEKTLEYDPALGGYEGTTLAVPNGTALHIYDNSVTPPPDIALGMPVTITMQVDFDDEAGILMFTFGPHGTTFDPPAEIWLSYKELQGQALPKLYYITDDGQWVEQDSYDVDRKGKKITLRVHHFSRYAIAHSQ